MFSQYQNLTNINWQSIQINLNGLRLDANDTFYYNWNVIINDCINIQNSISSIHEHQKSIINLWHHRQQRNPNIFDDHFCFHVEMI